MLNRVELIGGLTREPVLTFAAQTGVAICELSLAMDFGAWDPALRQRVLRTSYLSCRAWAEVAEQIAEAGLGPGDEVYLMGRVEQREIPREGKTPERKTTITVLIWQIVRRRHRASGERPTPPDDPAL